MELSEELINVIEQGKTSDRFWMMGSNSKNQDYFAAINSNLQGVSRDHKIDEPIVKKIMKIQENIESKAWDLNGKTTKAKNQGELNRIIQAKFQKNRFVMQAIGQMVKGVFVEDWLSERKGKLFKYRQMSPLTATDFKAILGRDEVKALPFNIKIGTAEDIKWLLTMIEEDTNEINEWQNSFDDYELISYQLPKPVYMIENDPREKRAYKFHRVTKLRVNFNKKLVFTNDDPNEAGDIELSQDYENFDWWVCLVNKYKLEIEQMYKDYSTKAGEIAAQKEAEIEEIKKRYGKYLIIAQLREDGK